MSHHGFQRLRQDDFDNEEDGERIVYDSIEITSDSIKFSRSDNNNSSKNHDDDDNESSSSSLSVVDSTHDNSKNNNDSDTGECNDDSVQVVVEDTSQLWLSVKTLTGQVIRVGLPLERYDDLSVLDVKEVIMRKKQVTPDLQRLIFRGKELQDTDMLRNEHIEDGSVLHMVLKLVRNTTDSDNNETVGAPHVMEDDNRMANGGAVDDTNWDRIVVAHRLGVIVRIFAFIDAIYRLLLAMQAPYQFFGWFLCICGYYGAQTFNYRYIALYLLYLVGITCIQLYQVSVAEEAGVVVIYTVGILIELFIFNVTRKFFLVVTTLSPGDRAQLALMNRPVH